MDILRETAVVTVLMALGVSFSANAAPQKEDDSAYKWGRWAVLSPAAGGEPYVAPLTPDAVNNARPETAIEFEAEVLAGDEPPVIDPPVVDDPRDRLPPRVEPPVADDPRDRLPPV